MSFGTNKGDNMPRKNGRPPAFMFYAGDFLSDSKVLTMTMPQRGMYISLLASEWLEGSLLNDTRTLKAICGQHPNFEEDWEIGKQCFYEEDGRLYNKRLELERTQQSKRAEKNSKNGKLGAMKRWNKKDDSEAIARPLPSIEKEIEIEHKKIKKDNNIKTYLEEFENEFWSAYPRRDNKKRAKDKYVQLRKSGTDKNVIINGLKFTPQKKKFEYKCIECGIEKSFDEEMYELCECGEGILEDKKHVMQELARNAAKQRAGKPGDSSLVKASTPDRSKSESGEAKDFRKMVSGLANSLGA